MGWVFDIQVWASLLTLTVLEIVLGIDNIIFISLLAGKMPREKQAMARRLGLGFALITRILLLCSLFWLTRLTQTVATVAGVPLSWRSFVLIFGGLFLIVKGTHEIHGDLEESSEEKQVEPRNSLAMTIVQIMLVDIVLSIDSVITAVGVASHLGVMIAAIVAAVCVMLWASGPISDFVNRHPTVRMLALCFLLLIGMVLIADGCGREIPRGYIYFAMAFSFGVEMLNLRARRKRGGPG